MEDADVLDGARFDLVGNDLANKLSGNDAVNMLTGGDGNES